MLELKVSGAECTTTAKGTASEILTETVIIVLGAARVFSETTHIPMDDAIPIICATAMKNHDSNKHEGKIVRFEIPKGKE